MASLLSHTQGVPLSVVTSERIVVYGEIFMDRFSSHLLASCDLVHFDSPRHGYGWRLTEPIKVSGITCSCLETAI